MKITEILINQEEEEKEKELINEAKNKILIAENQELEKIKSNLLLLKHI